ncbi:MAG: LPD23 domain-containing protein, partial [Dysosmobacter welbionis]
ARRADLDALDRAKEMERQGVAMETIFRETGWYTGADGKWRFESDDSGMEYSRWGDLNRSDRAEYARFRELEGKFIDGTITQEEQTELRQLLDQGHGPGRAEEQQTLRAGRLPAP